MYHIPVLLDQCIDGLEIRPDGTYVDVTFGGGGHSRAILNQLSGGRLIAFDQDTDSQSNIPDDDRFTLISQNFRYLKNFLRLHQAIPVDGILADLGVSSHQIDVPERGFSSRNNGNLDMRMNQAQSLSAMEVVNNYPLEALRSLFEKFGELKNSHKLASSIIDSRNHDKIQTTGQLNKAISHCFPSNKLNKGLAMVFQAIRIEVNEELKSLEEFLLQTYDVLKTGGRLAIIAYHSLEDRLVKNYIRSGNFEGKLEKDFYGQPLLKFKSITRKPIVPDESEIVRNSRSRSAKLRIAEKVGDDR